MNRSRMNKQSRTDSRNYTIQLRKVFKRYLPQRGLPLHGGAGRWVDRMLVMTVLMMVMSSLGTLADRFSEARATVVKMYPSRRRPGRTYAGFIEQLAKRSAKLLALVMHGLRCHVERVAGVNWKVAGHLAFGVDGSKSDAPRTRANENGLKIAGKNKSVPQQLLVALVHLGTGLPWSFRRGQANASERSLLIEQLACLPAKVLLVGDAGFVGYMLLQTILHAKCNLLVRAGRNVRLLRELGWDVQERGDCVYIWPERARKDGLVPLVLRQIVLMDGRNRCMCLLTNLDSEALTLEVARELYQRRWGIEVFFRGLKQTLARRKMLSKTPEHAQVELDWTLVGYWILGLWLCEQRVEKVPVSHGLAWTLRLVRSAMTGRLDRRSNLTAAWRHMTVDRYVRLHPKKARDWPHKKNDPPCGMPHVRLATPIEIRYANALAQQKIAA